MLLLQLGRLPPQRLLLREDLERVGVNAPRRRDLPLPRHRLGVVHPDRLPILLLHIQMHRRLDNSLSRNRTPLTLRLLRLRQPLFPTQLGPILLQRRTPIRNDRIDLFRVPFLLLQPSRCDPDLVRRRDRFASFVEDLTGSIGGFETREGEPEFLRVGDDFDGAGEEDAGVLGVVFELDGLFPEFDGGGDVLERCFKSEGRKEKSQQAYKEEGGR